MCKFGPVLFLWFAFVYLYPFPYFEKLRSANEMPRILLTEQIVEQHTFRIDQRLGELGSRFDVATTPDGHAYPNKSPGLSFLAVPTYAVLHALYRGRPPLRLTTWALRVTTVTLPSLFFLLAFYRLSRHFAPGPEGRPARRAALLAYGLGSMALPYGILFLSHQVAAACVGGAFVLAVTLVRAPEKSQRDLRALFLGLLCGLSVFLDYQTAIAAALVGLYLCIRSSHRLRECGLALLGALPPAMVQLAYHKACFGSPFRTGYSFAVDSVHKQGGLGVIGPNLEALKDTLVLADNGLLVLMPWVVLAGVGAAAIARSAEARARMGAEALCCGLVVIGYVLFLGSLVPAFARAGWCVGPRYMTMALPFCGWLAVAGLQAVDRHLVLRTMAHALVLCGVVIYVVATMTYPHWPTSFTNPLYQVAFRGLREGLVASSLGNLMGLRSTTAIVPGLIAAAGLSFWLLVGRSWGRSWRRIRTTLLAALLCAVLLWSYHYMPLTHPPTPSEQTGIEQAWKYVLSISF